MRTPKPIERQRRRLFGERLEKKLERKYAPCVRIDETFRNNDVTIVTNEQGLPVTLYIGKRNEDGSIKGDRYVRQISKMSSGETKSHWERKGKVNRYK
ncbi:hypothetical protein RCC89_13715 [Cytophagaceae bacterium ABcell3]|nr:hypothetical protein RCC89_13715 [Cytophagaceae bacterium ABcell3]